MVGLERSQLCWLRGELAEYAWMEFFLDDRVSRAALHDVGGFMASSCQWSSASLRSMMFLQMVRRSTFSSLRSSISIREPAWAEVAVQAAASSRALSL